MPSTEESAKKIVAAISASPVDRVLAEIQEETRAARQQSHNLTVSLTAAQHEKLVRLSEHLQLAKTNLAARLLNAAVDEADSKMFPPADPWNKQSGASPSKK